VKRIKAAAARGLSRVFTFVGMGLVRLGSGVLRVALCCQVAALWAALLPILGRAAWKTVRNRLDGPQVNGCPRCGAPGDADILCEYCDRLEAVLH